MPEPLVRGPDQTRKMPLDIFNVVELGRKRVLYIDNDDFPVGFALVQKSHDSKDFDLLDLTDISDLFTDFTDIEGIVVAFGFGLGVLL